MYKRITSSYSKVLPNSFFILFPLYLGVELILGICILNKCSGFYGILALFTGHPLSIVQWLTYIWSIFTLLIYTQGMFHIKKPNVYLFSQIFTIFSLDTIFTLFLTLYFALDWFSSDHSNKQSENSLQRTEKDIELSQKQGASSTYELFLIVIVTLFTLISRCYYNLVLASFLHKLFINPKFIIDQDDVETDLKNKSFFKKFGGISKKLFSHFF
ncbi:hypothetical protein TBLA_0G02010 [Henningerozyma blattae CBS 6284]|uniref:Inositol phosphorylceramide synthase regulatory subunit KEI1 n=1 Tax=Henningerozyma blattae (strain ATCC 34711 / CBS 6284 / DSM 70876 / NBRC 10599 / NRRL Y-10934 / UCD 77-7) TaxID=1071380 RepID=I2H6Z1_HENB6|nr:hypothetical protein TBLA_0G02010 [Tetrapisispora blattae CBS 6284]CCH62143.1 hypothetical protein TBLA_0G02010 [Tetrapisispora blattae CBS 6284]